MKKLIGLTMLIFWGFQTLEAGVFAPDRLDSKAFQRKGLRFRPLTEKFQIILMVDNLADVKQRKLSSELVSYLHSEGWLKKVLIGEIPATEVNQKKFEEFNAWPDFGVTTAEMVDFFQDTLNEVGMLNLLQHARQQGVEVFPGTTFSLLGSVDFHREYPNVYAENERRKEIERKLSKKGYEVLLEAIAASHPDAMNDLYRLDLMVSKGEATAFYGQQQGTLIIMSTLMYASMNAGVGVILNNQNPFFQQAAGVLISMDPKKVKMMCISEPNQELKRLYYLSNHFDFWFAPDF